MIRLLAILAALILPGAALAQTVTITSPNTVNPSGQPKAVSDVFVRNPDGTIASTSAPQGASAAGQSGTLAECVVVTGNQTYTAGTLQPLNCITTGRLKVGVSSAAGIDPALMLTTTLTADLVGCKSYAARATWADGYTGALQCDFGGNLNVNVATPVTSYETPNTLATAALVPVTTLAATTLVAKAAPGNFYGATMTNSTAAGFMIVANLAAAPTSGTALTPAQVLQCVPAAAGGVATAGGSGIPDRATVGITVLASTSCGTYTALSPAPLHMRARAQ